MSLILVQADGVWVPTFEVGRFTIEKEAGQSIAHLAAAVDHAEQSMTNDLTKRGYIFIGPDWTVKGPLGHMEFSSDASSEPDLLNMPDPLDIEGNRKWEAAERARVAHKYGEAVELVDFTIGAYFKRRQPQHLRTTRGSVFGPALVHPGARR